MITADRLCCRQGADHAAQIWRGRLALEGSQVSHLHALVGLIQMAARAVPDNLCYQQRVWLIAHLRKKQCTRPCIHKQQSSAAHTQNLDAAKGEVTPVPSLIPSTFSCTEMGTPGDERRCESAHKATGMIMQSRKATCKSLP